MKQFNCSICGKSLLKKNPPTPSMDDPMNIEGHYTFCEQNICINCWDKIKHAPQGHFPSAETPKRKPTPYRV